MGITRQYLRWSETSVFGVIGSANGGIVWITNSEFGRNERIIATAVCEGIAIWDTKTGQQIKVLRDGKSEVMSLCVNCDSGYIASGHSDGTIRLFDYKSAQLKVTFSGHKSAVTALCFDANGLRLASGGKDTDIVVWDVTNECGLFRLKGHKAMITKLQFMNNHNIIISSSKDTFIKFWDINTQHCFKTLVGHKTEVLSFALINNDLRLISGANDSELRVWDICFKYDDSETYEKKLNSIKNIDKTANNDDNGDNELIVDEENDIMIVERVGTIMRKSTQRLTNITVDKTERVLICYSKDAFVECFKIRTEDEVKNSIRNRTKREKKRKNRLDNELDDNLLEATVVKTLNDEIERLDVIKASTKIKYCDIVYTNNQIKIAILLVNNSVELYSSSFSHSQPTSMFGALQLQAHRTDVRTVSISSDNSLILSASAESLKIWNVSSGRCIATITDGVEYALCSMFAPGDHYCVLGTKTGKLLIFDVGSAELQNTINASDDGQPIWSTCAYPNLKGLVSGSEDKFVKFWDFELYRNQTTNIRQLSVVHRRTLTMDDGVLCVKISPNSKFVAVSLLDNTVKIFFMDTLKFFLSLYGHKFPVLTLDISYDSTMIATGSSDKNVKLWGLDFGDCHKSIFSHDDNIMCLQFVPKTHYFFTCSKDKKLKQWDADNYEKILTLEGHQAEIWTLAISTNGKFVVTASHDKSLRIWSKTNEPLVLEEEQENERENEFEKSLFGNEAVIPGETNKETTLASKKTVETIKGAEKLIEALDVFYTEIAMTNEYEAQCKVAEKSGSELPAKPSPNPLMNVYNTTCPYRYMLEVLRRIKSNEIEETLLTLPFNYVINLLKVLTQLLERKWEIELLCRCICFITRVNFGQIVSSSGLLPTLDKLRAIMNDNVSELKDMVGVNLSALQYYHSVLDSKEEISLFGNAIDERNEKKKRKAKRQSTTAPILTWT